MTYQFVRMTDDGAQFHVPDDQLARFKDRARTVGLPIVTSSPVTGGYAVTVGPVTPNPH